MSPTRSITKATAGFITSFCPIHMFNLDPTDDGPEVPLIYQLSEEQRLKIKIDFTALERDAQL